MADRGALEHLVIEAYKAPDYSGAPIDVFEAWVNPAEITVSYEVEFDGAQGAGTTNSRMEFKRLKPGDLALSFFLDGTGASGRKLDVQARVEHFMKVSGYNGEIHRPNYLQIAWGTLKVRRCVLKGATIAYKLFEPSGVPLRALITANFTDNSDDKTRVAFARDQSPDLVHSRLVGAGDTLYRLCAEVYGDPLLYPKVAAFNGLDDLRSLPPGTRLVFPPLRS